MSELTPKQELFCLRYVEIGSPSEAYRRSYAAENMNNDSIRVEANRLLDNPYVTLRIEELKAHHFKRHEVTVDSLTEELEEARLLAKQTEQPAPMISASMGKAKLHGLATDKAEIKAEIETKDTTPVDFLKRVAFLFAAAEKELDK